VVLLPAVSLPAAFPQSVVLLPAVFPLSAVLLLAVFPQSVVLLLAVFPQSVVLLLAAFPQSVVLLPAVFPQSVVLLPAAFPQSAVLLLAVFPQSVVLLLAASPLSLVSPRQAVRHGDRIQWAQNQGHREEFSRFSEAGETRTPSSSDHGRAHHFDFPLAVVLSQSRLDLAYLTYFWLRVRQY
jgi:hypothetical protein